MLEENSAGVGVGVAMSWVLTGEDRVGVGLGFTGMTGVGVNVGWEIVWVFDFFFLEDLPLEPTEDEEAGVTETPRVEAGVSSARTLVPITRPRTDRTAKNFFIKPPLKVCLGMIEIIFV
jgi:hypothetical protein